MADKPKETLQLHRMLVEDGLEFRGLDPSGKIRVLDSQDGKEGLLDLPAMMKEEGLDPKGVKVEYNTPTSALEDSPLSFADSMRVAFGNEKGGTAFLKAKFPDAQVTADPEKGLVMQDQGVWKRVQPDLLGPGDAWEKTGNALKLMAFIGTRGKLNLLNSSDKSRLASSAAKETAALPNAILSGAGAAAGSTLGPAGTIAGAGAGGALAAAARTSLGRMVGTYDAEPDEELKDIAMEAVLTAGGQAVALGAKPTFQMLSNATKRLKGAMTEAGQTIFTESVGKMSGVGAPNMNVLIEDNGGVIGKINSYAARASGDVGVAIETAGRDKVRVVTELVKRGTSEVPARYGKNLSTLATSAKDGPLKFSMGEMRDSIFNSLSDEDGLGFVTDKGFKTFGPKAVATRITRGKSAELLDDAAVKAVRPLLDTIDEFGKLGELRGEAGAKVLTRLQTFLNKQKTRAWGANTLNPDAQRILSKVSDAYHNYVGKVFHGAGLSAEYTALAEPYLAANDWLDMGRAALADKSGKVMEAFTNRATSGIGKNLTAKGQLGKIVEFLGPEGNTMHKEFLRINAAQSFLPRMPKMGFLQAGAAGGITYGAVAGAGNATGAVAIGAPLLAHSSPRFVAREVQMAQKVLPYARKTLDFMKGLGPNQMSTLLQDPAAMGALMRSVSSAPMHEEQLKNELLEKVKQAASPQTGEPQ